MTTSVAATFALTRVVTGAVVFKKQTSWLHDGSFLVSARVSVSMIRRLAAGVSAGQTLTVTWKMTSGSGNLHWNAVSLH
jgi:hypothetical protein